jgi:flagellar biosynthesis/type III secretory pathway M-ring protein FliF/YscJ
MSILTLFSEHPSSPTPHKQNKVIAAQSTTVIIIVCIILGSAVLLGVVVCVMYKRRRRRMPEASSDKEVEMQMLPEAPEVPNHSCNSGVRKFTRTRLSSNFSQVRFGLNQDSLSGR